MRHPSQSGDIPVASGPLQHLARIHSQLHAKRERCDDVKMLRGHLNRWLALLAYQVHESASSSMQRSNVDMSMVQGRQKVHERHHKILDTLQ